MTGARKITLWGAIGIGVGSMLGAGVFSGMWADVLGAGRWYLAAVLVAAGVALANALSTAQLAAAYPVAGGAYAYGRAELGRTAGHVAGAAFVVGKTVSVAVAATVLGAYVLPGHPQWVATAAIAAAWALNSRGITRTAWGATVIAVVVVAVLVVLVAMSLGGPHTMGWFDVPEPDLLGAAHGTGTDGTGSAVEAFLVAAAAAFFAFAGYARIATLGEEVRSPERTIPQAIVAALAIVVVLYLALAVALHAWVVPASGGSAADMRLEEAPLQSLADAVGMPVWIVTGAAVLSIGGAMLAVMAGAGRTAMAMAREGDLPRMLAAQGASGAPWKAEGVIAISATALVWTQGVALILVSVASILTYYAVANLAAMRQRRAGRTSTLRVPVGVSVAGLGASVVLAVVALGSAGTSVWPTIVVMALVLGWPVSAALVRGSREPQR